MSEKLYTLLDENRQRYKSPIEGKLGGHWKNRIYGRLDCQFVVPFLAAGTYQKNRVFFADEDTAIASGFRPCGRCMKDRHAVWKAGVAAGLPFGSSEFPWKRAK